MKNKNIWVATTQINSIFFPSPSINQSIHPFIHPSWCAQKSDIESCDIQSVNAGQAPSGMAYNNRKEHKCAYPVRGTMWNEPVLKLHPHPRRFDTPGWCCVYYSSPKTNKLPLKMDAWKTSLFLHFQVRFVSFREGVLPKKNTKKQSSSEQLPWEYLLLAPAQNHLENCE